MSDASSNSEGGDGEPSAAADGLSQYERQRLENIAKNKKVLEALGLIDGGSLVQRKSAGNNATMRRREKEKPAFEKRERAQRSVKPVERLDPGADRLRRLERMGKIETVAFTGPSSTLIALPRVVPSSIERRGYGYGLSDAVVFRRFYGSAMTNAFVWNARCSHAEAADEQEVAEEEDEAEEVPAAEAGPPPEVNEKLQIFYEGEVCMASVAAIHTSLHIACGLHAHIASQHTPLPPLRVCVRVVIGRWVVLWQSRLRRAATPAARLSPPARLKCMTQ